MKNQNLLISVLFFYTLVFSFNEFIYAQNRIGAIKPDTIDNFPFCTPSSGTIIDSMESIGDWHELMGSGAISTSLITVDGYNNKAIELSYDLGSSKGAWAQIRCDFATPINISNGDHIRFYYKGTAKNTLEIGLVSGDDQNYFAGSWQSVTHMPKFTYATWDLQDFRKDDRPFPDFNLVKAIFISVANKDFNDTGGEGSLIIDELQYLDIGSRTVYAEQDTIISDTSVTNKATRFIQAQQQPDSLLKSWKGEEADFSWLYDQGIGLIVLSETNKTSAKKLAHKLINLQNSDGSWYEGYNYFNDIPLSQLKPLGAIAWTIYGLMYYYWCSLDIPARYSAVKGANWLAALQRENGSLPTLETSPKNDAPTETNLDGWWAFHCSGLDSNADKLRDFLLNKVWDNVTGRFKSGPNHYHIFLDNQTWGASFLDAIDSSEYARRALSYASHNLVTQSGSANDTICGFDGAGPFSIWNEGTLQYIAAGGENSQYYWDKIIKQQALDGGLPGSPDSLSAYIVWLTKWHGIAPTSWLYFAGTGGPFKDSCEVVTSIDNEEPEDTKYPKSYVLNQNFPNPFNPETKIKFSLPERSIVKLIIYDILGRKIITLENSNLSSGNHEKNWKGIDAYGRQVSSGIYFYRFYARGESGKEYSKVMKMMLIK
jgi:hypothetical protein